MTASDQPGLQWTVVLRRRPVRMVAGEPEEGYADSYEIICCECGDQPELDYRDVSPELQRIRGPYSPIAVGVAAYRKHVKLHTGRRRPVKRRREGGGGSPCQHRL